MLVDDTKMIWNRITLAYKSKLKLNIIKIKHDIWNQPLPDSACDFNIVWQIELNIEDFNQTLGNWPLTQMPLPRKQQLAHHTE